MSDYPGAVFAEYFNKGRLPVFLQYKVRTLFYDELVDITLALLVNYLEELFEERPDLLVRRSLPEPRDDLKVRKGKSVSVLLNDLKLPLIYGTGVEEVKAVPIYCLS